MDSVRSCEGSTGRGRGSGDGLLGGVLLSTGVKMDGVLLLRLGSGGVWCETEGWRDAADASTPVRGLDAMGALEVRLKKVLIRIRRAVGPNILDC